jgi:hypothetical protein
VAISNDNNTAWFYHVKENTITVEDLAAPNLHKTKKTISFKWVLNN